MGPSAARQRGVADQRRPVDRVEHPERHPAAGNADLTDTERRLLGDLFAIVEEHAEDAPVVIDRERVEDAFVFACEDHADQRRVSAAFRRGWTSTRRTTVASRPRPEENVKWRRVSTPSAAHRPQNARRPTGPRRRAWTRVVPASPPGQPRARPELIARRGRRARDGACIA